MRNVTTPKTRSRFAMLWPQFLKIDMTLWLHHQWSNSDEI